MQILGQSLIHTNPAVYTHLGYTSAVPNRKEYTSLEQPVMLSALLPIVVGILLCTSLGRRLRARTAIIGALMLCGIGLMLVPRAGWFAHIEADREEAAPYRYPVTATYDHAWHLQHALHGANAIPSDWATSLDSGWKHHADDGWKRRMRIQPVSGSPGEYHVVSAGPDGRFATVDDLVITNQVLTDRTWRYNLQ